MKLVFENSECKRREIGQPKTREEAYAIISKFLEDHKYKSYYTIVNPDKAKHEIRFDVGSHSEFFYLVGLTDSEMDAFMTPKKG